MVLMSADNDPEAARDGDYSFKMPQKIPSYLLAIAARDLVFRPISERSGVWAEPAMVEQAQAEFVDTEKMIMTAESLYGDRKSIVKGKSVAVRGDIGGSRTIKKHRRRKYLVT